MIDKMVLSINCKDAGDPVCNHTMDGETEEELLKNAKKHGIKEYGYTEGLGMRYYPKILNILKN